MKQKFTEIKNNEKTYTSKEVENLMNTVASLQKQVEKLTEANYSLMDRFFDMSKNYEEMNKKLLNFILEENQKKTTSKKLSFEERSFINKQIALERWSKFRQKSTKKYEKYEIMTSPWGPTRA
jgi:hypothetical protein